MSKPIANKKVTLSISPKFYSQLELQSEALDITVNTLLKQSALASFSKMDIIFLTSEQRLIIKEFTLNQIKLSQTLQQINENLGRNSNAFPLEKILDYMKQYHETFVKLIESLKASKWLLLLKELKTHQV